LVRRLCEHCKEPQTLTPKEIQTYFEWDGQTPVSIFRPKGCDRCNMRGYFGRVAIHEICHIDNDLRNLIAANASLDEIETLAVTKGFQNLRYDGFKKVLRGLTTIEEVDRVAVVSE
ncbi:MAG: type II/IV secretion system protein, partial [Lentisphaerae bacterium]|nr:type II/IV secretion system protein [Lentisphaerota bacterium]